MASQIKVRSSNPGYPGRWRAGDRFFQHGVEVSMTVVEDPEGGPALKASEPIDPATGKSDMARISRAGLAELKADGECFTVLEGDQATSAAALDAAIAQATAATGDAIVARSALAAAQARITELEAELAALAPAAEDTGKAGGKPKK